MALELVQLLPRLGIPNPDRNVFVEEDMDTDVLDYLRVLFPHAMSLYNHCADVDDTSGELRFSHRTSA